MKPGRRGGGAILLATAERAEIEKRKNKQKQNVVKLAAKKRTTIGELGQRRNGSLRSLRLQGVQPVADLQDSADQLRVDLADAVQPRALLVLLPHRAQRRLAVLRHLGNLAVRAPRTLDRLSIC